MLNEYSELVEYMDGYYYVIFNFGTKTFRVWFDETDEYCLQYITDDYDVIDICMCHGKKELFDAIRKNS